MKKGKIVTGIGAVLLTIGIIGSVLSGVVSIPKIINNIQNIENNLNKEEILYNKQVNLTKLNINSKTSKVIIQKYDGQNIVVKRSGNKNLTTITTKENASELTINEELNNNRLGKSIDDIVRYFVDRLYKSNDSNIIMYVPNNIDINVNTNNNRLIVNDVNINNLNFNTSHGEISLNENSNINNLNIKSYGSISLKLREVYCTDNLSINSKHVNIHEDTIINDETKIPERVKILISNNYKEYGDDSVVINTNLPIAKNLDINSNETVELNLPILDYKFNFDIKTSNSIYFDKNSKNKYVDTSLNKYFRFDDDKYILNQSNFEGLINEKLINNPLEYFINIRSENVKFN